MRSTRDADEESFVDGVSKNTQRRIDLLIVDHTRRLAVDLGLRGALVDYISRL